MKKLAIFTEGQTEQLLCEQLILFLAGDKNITIQKISATGGSTKNKPRIIQIALEANTAEYFILIVDCGTDSKVKSDILERYDTLRREGFQKILGLRDVYPLKCEELPKLRIGLESGLPTISPKIQFILGVMEIEAWILAEYKHYPNIDPSLTVERIKRELAINVLKDDLSIRPQPAKDLSDIYWLEKINYDKSKKIITRILQALDKTNLKETVTFKFEDLNKFYQEVEEFLMGQH